MDLARSNEFRNVVRRERTGTANATAAKAKTIEATLSCILGKDGQGRLGGSERREGLEFREARAEAKLSDSKDL